MINFSSITPRTVAFLRPTLKLNTVTLPTRASAVLVPCRKLILIAVLRHLGAYGSFVHLGMFLLSHDVSNTIHRKRPPCSLSIQVAHHLSYSSPEPSPDYKEEYKICFTFTSSRILNCRPTTHPFLSPWPLPRIPRVAVETV